MLEELFGCPTTWSMVGPSVMGLKFLLDPLVECGGLDPSVEVVIFVPSIERVPLLKGFSNDLKVVAIIIEVLAALLLDESPEVFGAVYMVPLLGRVKLRRSCLSSFQSLFL